MKIDRVDVALVIKEDKDHLYFTCLHYTRQKKEMHHYDFPIKISI